jgi:hypothetical protein
MSDQVEPTTQNESNENLDIGKYLSLTLLEIIKDNPDYLLDKYTADIASVWYIKIILIIY